jgi:hypothetical protein
MGNPLAMHISVAGDVKYGVRLQEKGFHHTFVLERDMQNTISDTYYIVSASCRSVDNTLRKQRDNRDSRDHRDGFVYSSHNSNASSSQQQTQSSTSGPQSSSSNAQQQQQQHDNQPRLFSGRGGSGFKGRGGRSRGGGGGGSGGPSRGGN